MKIVKKLIRQNLRRILTLHYRNLKLFYMINSGQLRG